MTLARQTDNWHLLNLVSIGCHAAMSELLHRLVRFFPRPADPDTRSASSGGSAAAKAAESQAAAQADAQRGMLRAGTFKTLRSRAKQLLSRTAKSAKADISGLRNSSSSSSKQDADAMQRSQFASLQVSVKPAQRRQLSAALRSVSGNTYSRQASFTEPPSPTKPAAAAEEAPARLAADHEYPVLLMVSMANSMLDCAVVCFAHRNLGLMCC